MRNLELLPRPRLSLALLVMWLLLNNSVALGHILLGALLAVIIPWLTGGFWAERTPLHRPRLAARLLGVVLWDIVVANLNVARLVLGPRSALHPRFVRLPLDLREEFAIVLLANTISLTPGTVSVDVAADRRSLLVHCLDEQRPEALIARIKQRYEQPIKEIFRC